MLANHYQKMAMSPFDGYLLPIAIVRNKLRARFALAKSPVFWASGGEISGTGYEPEADWPTILGLVPVLCIIWQQIGNSTARATAKQSASAARGTPARESPAALSRYARPETPAGRGYA
jgi:hypothetical protein